MEEPADPHWNLGPAVWFSVFVFAAFILALLGAALAAYIVSSYGAALEAEENACWMRGRLGAWALEAMLRCGKLMGSAAHDARMRDAALARASVLAAEPPQPGGVCFVGSSTFTYWKSLTKDMSEALQLGAPPRCPDVRCWNAAFGGSCAPQQLAHIDALCTKWRPSVVLWFCGTNDINFDFYGTTPDTALDAFAAWLQVLRAACPATTVVYLAATVTPFVVARGAATVARFEAHNRAARAFAETHVGVYFVKSAPWQRGEPQLYMGDAHHLTRTGHVQLARLLAPAVRRALEHGTQLAGLAG